MIQTSLALITECPTNRTISASVDCTAVLAELTGELQFSPPDAVASVTQSPVAGTQLDLGAHTITFTVTDTNAVQYTCNALLTITDTTPPVMTGSSSKTEECASAWVFDEPVATDACGTNALTVLSTQTNLACAATFTATRIWQAVDASGNSATFTQTVAVVDTTPPTIIPPADRTIECGNPWSFGTPSATDACRLTTVVYDNTANDLMTRFDPGTNEVGNEILLASEARYLQEFSFEFWSTNLSGSPMLAGTNVTVRLRFYANDGTPFNGYPTPGTLLYDSGEFWLGTATTPRSVLVYTELDFGVYAAYPLLTALPTNFTWTVQFSGLGEQDQLGVDLFSPPVNGQSYGDYWWRTNGGWELRANETVAMDFAAQAMASTNQVLVAVVNTLTNATGSNTYTATRTWRATDACGNFTEASQTIAIVDTTPPVITLSPTNRSLPAAGDCLLILPDFSGEVVAADSCGSILIAQSPAPGAQLGIGNHALTFTVSDAASNTVVAGPMNLAVTPPIGAETNLTISEFMAKNTFVITDEDGTFSDWIEVHNAGPCMFNLDGWSLTDNASQLTKWRFPATNIAAGQYLLVWASDKNRRNPGAPLHTNFKLSDEGEFLALVRPDGTNIATQFAPTFPPQFSDVTYGRPTDRPTNSFLATATPGAANSVGTNFVVENLTFNPARGWFTNPVSVTIQSPTPGVNIYYTTNGTVPAPTNGLLYTAPLAFSGTTILRAVGYRTGYAPTPADGHTYIFPQQVAAQTGAGYPTNWGYITNIFFVATPAPASYTLSSNILNDPEWGSQFLPSLLSLPSLSIVLPPDDMFGTNGIYANTFGDGADWERPCSVEFFGPDVQPGFQINCGIRIHGGVSRYPSETSKHKLRLLFKQIYGAPFLTYNLYPGSPVNEFATLVLQAGFNDHWRQAAAEAQMQRDQWCADTQEEMGTHAEYRRYVQLYINGLYWGLYDIGERPDASYGAHYFGGLKADYDAFNGPDELTDGDWTEWDEMMAIINAGITNDVAYSNLTHYLNVSNFIDYLLINFYAANRDWPDNNWRAIGSIPRGMPFHFFNWDAEITFFDPYLDVTGMFEGMPTIIYDGLRQYPEFRRLFGDHVQRRLLNGGALTPQRGADRWMRRAQEIDPAIVAETARWGDNVKGIFTKTHWLVEQEYIITNWFPFRTELLISQLRSAGMYPALAAPQFSPHGGLIAASLPVTMSAPAGTIYFTTNGSDPRLPDGAVAPEALTYATALILTDRTTLRARGFLTNAWSALVEAEYIPADEAELRIQRITRLANGDVKLDCTATPGINYSLKTSTNLLDWATIATLTPANDGTFSYRDRTPMAWPARFYRLSSP